jgi:hypothetical protein
MLRGFQRVRNRLAVPPTMAIIRWRQRPRTMRNLRTRHLKVLPRKATTIASSSTDSTVDLGSFGPVGRSATEDRFLHLAIGTLIRRRAELCAWSLASRGPQFFAVMATFGQPSCAHRTAANGRENERLETLHGVAVIKRPPRRTLCSQATRVRRFDVVFSDNALSLFVLPPCSRGVDPC